jgi:hypothetical protein
MGKSDEMADLIQMPKMIKLHRTGIRPPGEEFVVSLRKSWHVYRPCRQVTSETVPKFVES